MYRKDVIINHECNFYHGMIGTVIEEYPQAVKVNIAYEGDWDEVMFYKEQIKLFR